MKLELTEQILKYVDDHGEVDTLDLVPVLGVDHQKIVGALKSIEANGELLSTVQTSRKTWDLTEEGKTVLANGSHEAFVFNAVPADGIAQADLMKVSLCLSIVLGSTCVNDEIILFTCITDFAKRQSRLQQGNGSRMDRCR